MKYPLALSTCWNSHRHNDGYAMLQEIRELGFEAAELSHGIRLALVPGVLKAVSEKLIRITSLHNFCPLPSMVNFAAPNYYLPTSSHKGERISWANQTIKTIHFCHDVGADLVVMHMGRVSFLWKSPWASYEKALTKAGEEMDDKTRDKLNRIRDKAAVSLAKAQQKVLGHLRECLDKVVPIAEKMGVRLAAENREDPNEVPVDHDGEKFWTEFAVPYGVGYWHDSGHAQIKENDGLLKVLPWMEKVHPHLMGWHLHDVVEDRDHQVPGSGCIDFKSLLAYRKPEHAITLELHPSATPEKIHLGVELLRTYLPGV